MPFSFSASPMVRTLVGGTEPPRQSRLCLRCRPAGSRVIVIDHVEATLLAIRPRLIGE